MPTARELRPMIIEAVKEVIREEITSRLDDIEEKLLEITQIQDKLLEHDQHIKDIEKAMEFTSEQIKEINEHRIPDLGKRFDNITTQICLKTLDLDTHRRKWSIIMNGLEGHAGELESETSTKVRKFATDKLKVRGAESHMFGACHRLSYQENAGIIIKFSDLRDRNTWLSNAKNLKNSGSAVSLSPDIHPCLRQIKKNILEIRKDLPPERKQMSQVKYLANWPYICLKVRGESTIHHTIPKDKIVKAYLEL